MSDLYENDFYAWASQEAALLSEGRLGESDLANIADEIESMGRGEKRELVSRLTVVLSHLLKWPDRRGASWEASIEVQRVKLVEHLEDNPSLKPRLAESIAAAYRVAVIEASAETGLPRLTFPPACPWAFDEIMDPAFWPDT